MGGEGMRKRGGKDERGKRRKEVVPSSLRMWLRLCHKAKNWGCPDTVDTNG